MQSLCGYYFFSLRKRSLPSWPGYGLIYNVRSVQQRILVVRNTLKALALAVCSSNSHCTPFSRSLLCEVAADEKSGHDSIMSVHCKEDNGRTRWALIFFFFFFFVKVLTPTILVFTQLVQIETVSAEMSKDFWASVRKVQLHLYLMNQLRVHISLFVFPFLA